MTTGRGREGRGAEARLLVAEFGVPGRALRRDPIGHGARILLNGPTGALEHHALFLPLRRLPTEPSGFSLEGARGPQHGKGADVSAVETAPCYTPRALALWPCAPWLRSQRGGACSLRERDGFGVLRSSFDPARQRALACRIGSTSSRCAAPRFMREMRRARSGSEELGEKGVRGVWLAHGRDRSMLRPSDAEPSFVESGIACLAEHCASVLELLASGDQLPRRVAREDALVGQRTR